MKSESVSIGIDLGTRNALCSYVNELGAVEAIRNRWGSLSTPSVVGWDGKWRVGEDAVRLALSGSEDVWWDVKRRVGSPFRAVLDGRGHAAHDLLVSGRTRSRTWGSSSPPASWRSPPVFP